jgi:uncharacterized membrane protein YsdA (DUF1294 family)
MFELLAWIYAAASLVAIALYAADKRRARRGDRRIPEACLHAIELFGGWPGALLAQRLFSHKTRKLRYQLVFWSIVLAHFLLLAGWLAR